jgi:hypothetical protein
MMVVRLSKRLSCVVEEFGVTDYSFVMVGLE